MQNKFIFDVDGTLTPSRGKMDEQFANWFEQFATINDVYMVTGSDRQKTLEQIPRSIYNLCNRVYQCAGGDVWAQDVNIRSGIISLPKDLLSQLDIFVAQSKFYRKTGHHIDHRPGLVNFSIVGRGCNLEERAMYREWDEHKNERNNIANKLRTMYPQYKFSVAGETGIDITTKDCDKSQILKDFDDADTIYFFGDKVQYGGNDHEIALAIHDREDKSRVFEVDCWKHTWKILKELV